MMWGHWGEPHYKEAHSADGTCYIEKQHAQQWKVVWGNTLRAIWTTRRMARKHIRMLKGAVLVPVVDG